MERSLFSIPLHAKTFLTGLSKNTHYGSVTHNVDMRAEVADLSRNILVRSDSEEDEEGTNIGGQIKVSCLFQRNKCIII